MTYNLIESIRSKLFLIALGLSFSFPMKAQVEYQLTELFEIYKKEASTAGSIKYLLPVSLPFRQEIKSITLSIEPDTLIVEGEDRFAIWNYKNLKAGDTISIITDLVLHRYDLTTAKQIKADRPLEEPGLEYSTAYFENKALNFTPIKAIAKRLKADSDLETVQNTIDFITNNFTYERHGLRGFRLHRAMKQGLADCTEYAEFFMALCHVNDIPTRFVEGKLFADFSRVEFHHWPEVYLDSLGWVPLDPTAVDTNPELGFETMSNNYAYYSYNDKRQYFYNDKGIGIKYYLYYNNATQAIYDKAIKYYTAGDNELAIIELEKYLAIAKNHCYANMFMSVALARLKQFDKGLPYLQTALSNAKSNTEKWQVHYAFANFLSLKGDLQEALDHLEKAFEFGLDRYEVVETDEDLVPLFELPRFKSILEELKSKNK